jgi:hypothetical protein
VAENDSLLLEAQRVYTGATDAHAAEAILVHAGRVRAVGEASELAQSGTRRVSFPSGVILPGLVDAHLHLEKYALSLRRLDVEVAELDTCLERVRRAAAKSPPGEWILGHGWNQNLWGYYGTRRELDEAAPHHPVYLTAKSLHAAWANTAALRLAGALGAPDPPDGAILRDESGAPTGILLEGAMRLVAGANPDPSVESLAESIERALVRLSSLGLTGVHDFDGPRCFAALQILREAGRLRLRVLKSVPADLLGAAGELGLRSGFGDDWLRLGHVKAFADGALGPRTAAMLQPYDDDPDNRGILLLDREQVLDLGLRAGAAGFPLAVHAIGDRANHEVLDAMEALRSHERSQGWPARRHRLEHLQLLHPDDLDRPARLGLIASMQPIHATSDRDMAELGWGRRVEYSYAWKSQLDAGATLAFGSDAPVESPNPFWGMYAAISRRRRGATPRPSPWTPQQTIAIAAAWRAFTEGPANAAGWHDRIGRLDPGFWADLVVLPQDPLRADPETLASLQPIATMVGGTWTFGGS